MLNKAFKFNYFNRKKIKDRFFKKLLFKEFAIHAQIFKIVSFRFTFLKVNYLYHKNAEYAAAKILPNMS